MLSEGRLRARNLAQIQSTGKPPVSLAGNRNQLRVRSQGGGGMQKTKMQIKCFANSASDGSKNADLNSKYKWYSMIITAMATVNCL